MEHELLHIDDESCLYPQYLQLVSVAVLWQGKVLLVHRNSEPFKGMWSVPGGHVEEDEPYRATAQRELYEETGIRPEELSSLAVYINHVLKIECQGITTQSPDGAFTNPDTNEQDVVGWKGIPEALQLPLTPGLSEVLGSLRD
jgi:ADP-ribose pyrophosphatase YjhB (NUDIX family)